MFSNNFDSIFLNLCGVTNFSRSKGDSRPFYLVNLERFHWSECSSSSHWCDDSSAKNMKLARVERNVILIRINIFFSDDAFFRGCYFITLENGFIKSISRLEENFHPLPDITWKCTMSFFLWVMTFSAEKLRCDGKCFTALLFGQKFSYYDFIGLEFGTKYFCSSSMLHQNFYISWH